MSASLVGVGIQANTSTALFSANPAPAYLPLFDQPLSSATVDLAGFLQQTAPLTQIPLVGGGVLGYRAPWREILADNPTVFFPFEDQPNADLTVNDYRGRAIGVDPNLQAIGYQYDVGSFLRTGHSRGLRMTVGGSHSSAIAVGGPSIPDPYGSIITATDGPFGLLLAGVVFESYSPGFDQYLYDSSQNGGQPGHRLRVLASGTTQFERVGSALVSNFASYTTPLTSGSTYHIYAEYDGSNCNLWVNGVQAQSNPATAGAAFDIGPDVIVGRTDNPYVWQLDDLAIWKNSVPASGRAATWYSAYQTGTTGVMGGGTTAVTAPSRARSTQAISQSVKRSAYF